MVVWCTCNSHTWLPPSGSFTRKLKLMRRKCVGPSLAKKFLNLATTAENTHQKLPHNARNCRRLQKLSHDCESRSYCMFQKLAPTLRTSRNMYFLSQVANVGCGSAADVSFFDGMEHTPLLNIDLPCMILITCARCARLSLPFLNALIFVYWVGHNCSLS